MIRFEKFVLQNGLRVIVHQDTSTPMAVMNIMYDVGARDEEPERTGFAHLFEHLMFGGSINIPTYDSPLQMAGGENLFGVADQPSAWLDWDEVVAADPDLILAHPCGFDMARTLQEMPMLERRAGWRELKAVQHDRIFIADGNLYFNRPGPRIVESLEMLAEIFHPELFPSRHERKGWMRYASEHWSA